MEFKKVLKDRNLSCTVSRLCLLQALMDAELPISEKELENRLPERFNRTTIYRNLNSLTEKGIIQRIFSSGSLRYKLSASQLNHPKDQDHIHFQCNICNQTTCLEDLKVKDYNLPAGYTKVENQFLIIGTCKECNEK